MWDRKIEVNKYLNLILNSLLKALKNKAHEIE